MNKKEGEYSNEVTLPLEKGIYPNKIIFDYRFRLCNLHLFFFPLEIVLFAIEIDDSETDVDNLTAAHNSLMGKWDVDSFGNSQLIELMKPLTKYLDQSKNKKLTKDGNKLKIFQTIKLETNNIDDALLYELGSSSPIGCVKNGNRPDMKPSESYFNMIMDNNKVSTFDSWKGLALVDSFTILGKQDSFKEDDCKFLYFPLIYLRCIFEKTFCFSRNNAYREDKADLKSLPQEIELMEKYYFYDNISYNFQPNLLYNAMAKGLSIKEEREELTMQVKESAKKEEEEKKAEEEKRRNKITFGISIFAVFSVMWDFYSLFAKTFDIEQYACCSARWAAIFLGVSIVLISILSYLIFKKKDELHHKDNR